MGVRDLINVYLLRENFLEQFYQMNSLSYNPWHDKLWASFYLQSTASLQTFTTRADVLLSLGFQEQQKHFMHRKDEIQK